MYINLTRKEDFIIQGIQLKSNFYGDDYKAFNCVNPIVTKCLHLLARRCPLLGWDAAPSCFYVKKKPQAWSEPETGSLSLTHS